MQPFCRECGQFHETTKECENLLQFEEREKIRQEAIEEWRKGLLKQYDSFLEKDNVYFSIRDMIKSYNLPTK